MQRLNYHREGTGPIRYSASVNAHNAQETADDLFKAHELVIHLDQMEDLENVVIVTPDGGTHRVSYT